MNPIKDPTYIRTQIDANPVWRVAWIISEHNNDNAPIGWSSYIPVAEELVRVGITNEHTIYEAFRDLRMKAKEIAKLQKSIKA